MCSGWSPSSYAITEAAVGRKDHCCGDTRSTTCCQQQVGGGRGIATPPVGVVSSVQLNPDTVDRAITGLLAVAGKVRDVSQLVGVCVCVCVCV